MAMARASSSLSYPDRFYAAAAYAGLDGSASPTSSLSSKFSNDVALILYALYQQATIGPCNAPKPRAWNPVEQSKWTSWNGLGKMASTEAMRLFVKILEEEVPGWYSRTTDSNADPSVDADVQVNHNSITQPGAENGNGIPETKAISSEYENQLETQDKDVVSEGLGSVGAYDEWVTPPISGPLPRSRYEHGAAVVQDKMYIFGGNHNGRYLSDLQVLDLRSWTWSKVEAKSSVDLSDSSLSPAPISPCAGHSLIHWDNKLLSVAGHTKDPAESIQVKVFDLQTLTWSTLKTYGKAPVSRGGQSVTLVGATLVIFGGEDAKRTLLNDLHILDLETMTWDDMEAIGIPPSPRSGHAAAGHAERYLLIFGGGSHATCFNDLHVLDLQSMEWSRPKQQGQIPAPRAGHAGVTIGENWFIAGGGNNTSGISETVVLNMSTLTWSVVTSVQGRVPVASEGLSLIASSSNGEDILVAFGGYNGRYSNEVHLLKPSLKSTMPSKVIEGSLPDSNSGVPSSSNGVKDVISELGAGQEGKIREISVDNDASTKATISKVEESGESLLLTLKKEKEETETLLSKEKSETTQLKQDVADAEARNAELHKELQSVRGQLASEQSRCFKLEVEVAELRSKLQTMDSLQKELELLQKQKAASEQASMNAKQRQSSGVWGWIAGTPPNQQTDDY
uniref:ACB domain-containing protein n=1 Tax=Kalanchoe fedtschenkoi TaxID=63787 RepID=A0A7N0R7Y4_KALFE